MTDGLAGLTSGDPHTLLERLAAGVRRALPADAADQALGVEYERSLKDRLSGQPGRASALTLTASGVAMTLKRDERGKHLVAESARVVGGVIISRRTMPIGEWLAAFAGQVGALAADAAGDAGAAATALTALGVQPAGADIAVPEADVVGGLAALAARIEGRVPPDAAATVARIAALLHDTLPRVAGTGEAEVLVRRTATIYLPDTLRAFVALPADWARTHTLANGLTVSEALQMQLDELEAAATRMRDAAVQNDASALLVNGIFLKDRFATSSLDLPH